MSIPESRERTPPVPEPLTEYQRLPTLLSIVAGLVILVAGVVLIALV